MKKLINTLLVILTVFVIQKNQTVVGITNLGVFTNILVVYDGPLNDHCYRHEIPIRLNGSIRIQPFYSKVTHRKYELIDVDFESESITIREVI